MTAAPHLHRSYRGAVAVLRALRRYHRHEVIGFEHIPATGPALLVFNHSLATYDAFLLEPMIRERLGRGFRGLADRAIFRTPGLAKLFRESGFVVGTRANAVQIMRDGDLLGLAPGGMKEALRPSSQRYRIDWGSRRGFAWVSAMSGAPVLLCACPNADHIYRVYDNPVTPAVYDRLKLPAPLFRGVGPTWVPRPVKLTHLVSEPIAPPEVGDDPDPAVIAAYHGDLVARMHRLMADARAADPHPTTRSP